MDFHLFSNDKVDQLRRGYLYTLQKIPGSDTSIDYINISFPLIFLFHYFAIIIFIFGNIIELCKIRNPNVSHFWVFTAVVLVFVFYYVVFRFFLLSNVSKDHIEDNPSTKKEDRRAFLKMFLIGMGLFFFNFIYFTMLQFLM